jgi:hypothetical protein
MRKRSSRSSAGPWCTGLTLVAASVLGLSMPGVLGGCADEPVGHSKTVSKTTIDTPSGKTTTTETHEKDTRIIERP